MSKLGTIGHLLMAGNWYPVKSVARTAVRRVPPHRKATYWWARDLCRRFAIEFHDMGSTELIQGRRYLLLCPHRSVADFFVHKHLADGRAATLSRMGVAVYSPMLWLATRPDRSTWFFKRGKNRGRAHMFRWLDREFERCPLEGLIVYPEGHRNHTEEPLKLKAGMLLYAFERKMPVQILMTSGTEDVIDEKKMNYSYGAKIPHRLEPPIDPAGFDGLSSFYDHVRERFASSFAAVRDKRREL